jgi:hypothetical protein
MYPYREDSAKYNRWSQTSSETTNCDGKIKKKLLIEVSDADVTGITAKKNQALKIHARKIICFIASDFAYSQRILI